MSFPLYHSCLFFSDDPGPRVISTEQDMALCSLWPRAPDQQDSDLGVDGRKARMRHPGELERVQDLRF